MRFGLYEQFLFKFEDTDLTRRCYLKSKAILKPVIIVQYVDKNIKTY